jgi:hypothetical protein
MAGHSDRDWHVRKHCSFASAILLLPSERLVIPAITNNVNLNANGV